MTSSQEIVASNSRQRWFAGAAMAVAIGLSGTAQAAGSDWAKTDHGQVRLVSAVDATGDSRAVTLGLEFKLKKGWKIYWRSPGDAGSPPMIDWTGSTNLADTKILWPTPTRFDVSGLTTLGYKDAVVLPIQAGVAKPGEKLTLRAKVDYLTCDDVCIPYTADLRLALPAGAGMPAPEAAALGAAMTTLPAAAGETLRFERATVSEIAKAGGKPGEMLVSLNVVALSTTPLAKPDLVVEHAAILSSEAPVATLEEGGRRATLVVPLAGDRLTAAKLAGADVTLTLLDAGRATEGTARVSAGAAPTASGGGEGLAAALLIALLGGLILNLMPCVLPVLSLKIVGAIGHGGQSVGRVRAGFLASAAGIVGSFLLLAGGAIGLQKAGLAVGWGIQFQQPVFVSFMVVVVALFALNLAGLFEIPLPAWLAESAVSTESKASRSELAGHFVSGVFATLLATPCSAPFVGTALTYALSRGPLEIAAVFAAMGVGLAAPFLLVAAFPALAARLPRPGAWMLRLKQVLSLALFATAAWLVTVLVGAADTRIALLVAGLCIVMAGAIAVRHRLGQAGLAAATLAGVLAIALPAFITASPPASAAASQGRWRTLDATRPLRPQIEAAMAGGKTVLVDVTADWCVTCQVNKKLVLNAGPLSARLERDDIFLLRADWTRPSDNIAAYLKAAGRYGIPFNIVYGPGAPDGVALPELLTTALVEDALGRAARR